MGTKDRGDTPPPFAKPRRKQRTDRQGLAWEMRLALWHDKYRADGTADVTKNNVPTKMIEGRLIRSGKADVDYDGTLDGGRSVRFDAKEVGEGGYLSLRKSHLPQHQRDALARHHELGAVCFLAVWFREEGEQGYRLFPWSQVAGVLQEGLKELWQGDGITFGEDEGWLALVDEGWLDREPR